MDYDVIIIGGGPAGYTAGIYNSRARLKTLLVESLSVAGQAVITDTIENYPGFVDGINGFDLIDRFKKQAEKFGTEIKTTHVKKISPCKDKKSSGWKIECDKGSFTSLALVIASGASPKKVGVQGEKELQGKGVSYCATCDGPLYRDKEVVVLGGGDTAVQEALFLTKFAKKVTLIHRRDRLRATKVLQERASQNKGMSFLFESVATEITGKDRVSSVKVKNVKTGKEASVSCDGVFVFVGYTPNTDLVKGVVKIDEQGYIATDEDMKTSAPGIFACGDCRHKLLGQVVTACGDGATAAFSAQHYVEELKGIAYK
ncbi:MAG: thioredoxin-disulfide reductase [Candidatus Omnitrophota bacterium]|jgi:thioredoxin reductase (NADPH)|nr:thioredoxin-disulfide reductase [Candidatus Omnitrophota bacterium]